MLGAVQVFNSWQSSLISQPIILSSKKIPPSTMLLKSNIIIYSAQETRHPPPTTLFSLFWFLSFSVELQTILLRSDRSLAVGDQDYANVTLILDCLIVKHLFSQQTIVMNLLLRIVKVWGKKTKTRKPVCSGGVPMRRQKNINVFKIKNGEYENGPVINVLRLNGAMGAAPPRTREMLA